MFRVLNLFDNDDIKTIDQARTFQVLEYQKDLSVNPYTAETAFYCNKMGVKKRQVVCNLQNTGVTLQSGAMQWILGDISATTGVKGVGDLLKKSFRGVATGESAIKPEYTGSGYLALEPTYKHILLVDVGEWPDGIVLEDGLFLACESTLTHRTVARSNVSSTLAGGEGLFNLCLTGKGIACLESNCPKEELIEIHLQNDVLKIDGSMAIAWSAGLQFTVERSSKTLIGSAVGGEGLVNVFRGTGRVLMAPVGRSVQFENSTVRE